MAHTIKVQDKKIMDYLNENIRYLTKEHRWETQEEVLKRKLKL